MTTVYADLGALAHRACKGNQKMTPLSALLDARREIIEVQCSPLGNEVVPFTLLEAVEKKRSVEVEVDGFRYAFGKQMRDSDVIEVDNGNQLLLVLQGPLNSRGEGGEAPTIKTTSDFKIRVDNSSNILAGTYDISNAQEATLRSTQGGKRPKVGYVAHIPLQSLEAQSIATKEKLALLELELYVTYAVGKRDSTRAVPVLQAVVVRVVMRPSKGRLQRETLAQTDRRGLMPSDTQLVPYKPAAGVTKNADERRRMADTMLGKLVERNDDFSAVVTRNGQRLLDVESGDKRNVYSAGELTGALTTAAVVKHIMERPYSHPVGEVNLHSRRLLHDLLHETGATEVLAALTELYARTNEELPSVNQLLTHTSGLPARAQIGVRDLQAMFADRGGLEASGSMDRDFAMLLRNKVQLVSVPDGVYHESALNLAVVMFALPGWDKNASALQTIREMAGSDPDGTMAFANNATDPGYQGMYKLYAGLRSDAASMATALSHPGWFTQSSATPHKGGMDWLQKLSEPRVLVSQEKKLAAGYGPWMNGLLDGTPVRYAVGRYEKDIMMAVQLPGNGTTGVLALRKKTRPLACAMPAMEALTKLMKEMTGYADTPAEGASFALRLPPRTRAAAQERKRMVKTMALSGRVDEPDADLAKWFGGEMVGLLDRDATMEIAPEMRAPDMTKRYVLTLHHRDWTQKWTVLQDDDRAPDPENPNGARGGLRVVDSLTGAMTESIYMGLLRSSTDGARAEPLIMFRGYVFARRSFSGEVQAALDPSSREAHERKVARQAQLERQRAQLADVRKQRAARRRAMRTDGDQSSDEEGSDDEKESKDEQEGDVLVEMGDLFQKLLNVVNVGGQRSQMGNWHQYIGCDSCSKKAGMCAYPTGERIVAVNDYYY